MGKKITYLTLFLLLIGFVNLFSDTFKQRDTEFLSMQSAINATPQDTLNRYPVKKSQITNYEDLKKTTPIDLRDPDNIKTEVVYDPDLDVYIFKSKVGDHDYVTPFSLTPGQYFDYSLQKSMVDYFKRKNAELTVNGDNKDDFSLKNIKVSTGALDRIFGPGGVQVKTSGDITLKAAIKRSTTDNPIFSQSNRTRTMFDFDEQIRLNASASVGDKINFGLNYDNTNPTFDFDSKKIKLAYEGKEDEILKYLEAGNVSMHTTNSLIRGGNSLFGIRADLQFGKLKISSVISQQQSQTQTVSTKGGVQTIPFEFKADAYDENQHFFLSYYFRDMYDEGMSKLPFVKSEIMITKLEVWVTNHVRVWETSNNSNLSGARNIVAFADLGEHDSIKNTNKWSAVGPSNYPDNYANNLYSTINNQYPGARDIRKVHDLLVNGAGLVSGQDFEKLENARLLNQSEYQFNPQLGFISLNMPLAAQEVLAVAYEYRVGNNNYKVGEFSSEIPDKLEEGKKAGDVYVKLLKAATVSPDSYVWDLMMKNIYNLKQRQIQQDKFRLQISYLNDTTGTYLNYLTEGDIKNEMLLKVMNLDRLNNQKNEKPDGIFDFIEGYTIYSNSGRVIFPTVEPFGSYLRKKFKDPAIAEKYVYQELYDSTLTVARQIADKNKFRISGSMVSSGGSASEINLNAMNVARGSVIVTANGMNLVENTDYTVDYTMGIVRIINQALIDAGTPINVSLENQSMFNMQRRTLMGVNLSYDFSKKFSVGGTFMHMYEKPLTMKTGLGNESLKNTLWGLNTSYKTESQWLTNLIDKLPFVEATAPSQISLNAEFAHMIPGHYENRYGKGYAYIDDFESAKSRISLHNPFAWKLASTPFDNAADALFPEAKLSNDISYGNNRAHLSWFTIDKLFTRENSSLKPSHIDNNALSNHFVREIIQAEIYPDRQTLYNETSTISAFNLSYYPQERGIYNLDSDNIDEYGRLLNPEKRWGGIMRSLDHNDFESSNIESIEFWLMDPFVYNDTATVKNKGGDLYFNLGDVSEDILKDGIKFYENGMGLDDPDAYEITVWGKAPKRRAEIYAFDNEKGNEIRVKQDVGLNGLSQAEERTFGTYMTYGQKFRSKLLPSVAEAMLQNDFSPLNDLSGDKYHYFRGSDYDRNQVGILDRYKYYNGLEGNSTTTDNSTEGYSTASTPNPDVEDLNQDFTMNETENYFQYKVSIRPDEMEIGKNFISNKREVEVNLRNGQTGKVTWYQFKIPIGEYSKRVGNIRGFNTIRFMRMFMTNFEQATFLRFATLDLVRGEWRAYTQNLDESTTNQGEGTIVVSAVNLEEDSEKTPVNYVLPPGETRIPDPSQPQLKLQNEQSLSIQVTNLAPETSRAAYKNTSHDLRRYKRLQMFTHLEELVGGPEITRGEISIFLRLGTDYKNNYYEYEIPLTVTPPGKYNYRNYADQLKVWPTENMFDFPLELLKDIKLNRNKKKRQDDPDVSFTKPYWEYDPSKPNNRVSVIGNPNLAEVRIMMIGVRNNSRTEKSAEIWVDELRLDGFDEEGGWAIQGDLNIGLSDIGNINFVGRRETAGFGAIDQGLNQRRLDDFYSYDISTNVDLGRFVPEKAKINMPLYYSYSNQTTTPKYDPLDKDVTLKEALSIVNTKAEKDSIKNQAQDKVVTKNFSLNNVKVNIQSKNPMPYDPANFTFGYAFSITETKNPTTVYDQVKNYKANLNYSYSPRLKTWEPFKNIKSKSGLYKYPKSLGFNFLPNNIAFNSYITRYYTETLMRDFDSYRIGSDNSQYNFLSWSQNFFWDRDFSLTWDLMKNLKISIQTGTRAEIEEPYLQVNKKMNRTDYDIWRDSVITSLRNLGTPLSYKQRAEVTYTLPTNNIPVLDWMSTGAKYSSNYNWDRGADVGSEMEYGNTVSNDITFTLQNGFNLTNLYNKSDFLKKVNQKFEARGRQMPNPANRQPRPQVRPFNREVKLNTDSATTVKHGLNTKDLLITARSRGREFKLKYKKVDANTIKINNKDTALVSLRIVPKGDGKESFLYEAAQYAARGLMSVRNVSVNYSRRQETAIGGFRPGVGDLFGQRNTDLGWTPGLDFAFGFMGGEDYLNRSLRNDWLVRDNMNISPAVFNKIEKVDLKAEIAPVKGMILTLTASREKSDRTTMQYNTGNDIFKIYGGQFSMTIISMPSLSTPNAKAGYPSKSFEKFLKHREIIANRLENQYQGKPYPNTGFLAGTNLGNYDFNNPATEHVNRYSADVLIPAFIAAYTGKDPNKVSLSPFPSLRSLLPNWQLTYDLLAVLPSLKSKFRDFTLTHAFESRYNIGSYSSFSTWQRSAGDLGFIKTLDDTPAPSSPYDISSVTIVQRLDPLLGLSGRLLNNTSIAAKYSHMNTLNLNVGSFQVLETLQRRISFTLGYRIDEFNKLIGLKVKKDNRFNNSLDIKAGFEYLTNQSLIRRVLEAYSETTSGINSVRINLSADYMFSRSLTLQAFIDRDVKTPLVTSSSYPTANTNFGISLKFTLIQ